MRRHRSEAARADACHTRALGRHPPTRLGIVHRREELLLADSDLERHRPLPRFGDQLLRIETMADLAGEPEPVEPRRREDDRVQPTLAPLTETCVDVPAQRLDGELRLECEQLCAAPRRSCPDSHPRLDRLRTTERV